MVNKKNKEGRNVMKKIPKKFSALFIFCCFAFLLIFPAYQAKAASGLLPLGADNLQIGLRRSSDFVAVENGYMRVFNNGKEISIEYYDSSFNIKSRRKLSMELKYWGGFYAGLDAYYLVEGQANTEESDTAEVIRVIKYDTSWNRLGAAKITGNKELFGGEVRYPFDYGCVEMAECGGKLYIVTGHEGYVDNSVGQGHQGFLMISVDTATMNGKIVVSDLWHSFAQYIKSNGSDLYVLEQSEGSRCTSLTRFNAETLESTTLKVLPYGGSRTSPWAVSCYASVDGMALSSDHILCLGTSIDQSKYDSVTSDMPHNIYLTVTPKSNFSESATTVKWLTNYTSGGKSFLGVKITKINDNRFMVSWEEYETGTTPSTDDSLSTSILHYVFVDGQGNKITKEYTQGAPISDCQPIVKDSNVIYYASNSNMVNFYSINSEDGSLNKKMYRVAGENATWDFQNGVLTISGTGPLNLKTKEDGRLPVSSTSHWFVSSETTPWSTLDSKIKKVVIKSGITLIPERAFSYLDGLTEVKIESGLLCIEKEAFYGCGSLGKITIPSSVTKIGDDILWTGYYWVGDESHVVKAVICAPQDSYAIQYAKKNGIYYEISMSDAKVSGLKKEYFYNGKSQTPNPTVKIGSYTLKKGTDYTVTYKNNKNVGTATVSIKGINRYAGTISRKFQIVPPKEGTRLTDKKTNLVYIVTKAGSQVGLAGTNDKTASSLNVPSNVKFGGVTYQVTSLQANAFKNNSKLKKVTIKGNVSSIGESAFHGCSTLSTVVIGSSVQTLGREAFYNCKKLTSVTLGQNLRSIESLAFANCTSMKKITIPARVQKIGSKAFYNCSKLTSMTVQTEKLTAKSIGSKAFTNMGRSKPKSLTVRMPKRKLSAYRNLFRQKGLNVNAQVK